MIKGGMQHFERVYVASVVIVVAVVLMVVWCGGEGCWKDMKPNGEETEVKKLRLNVKVSKMILDLDLPRFTDIFLHFNITAS